MKQPLVTLLLIAGFMAGLPAETFAGPRGSKIIRPDKGPSLPTEARPAPTPSLSKEIGDEIAKCPVGTNQGAPRSAFEDKIRELTAAGVARWS